MEASFLPSEPSNGCLGAAVSVCAAMPLPDQENQGRPLTQHPTTGAHCRVGHVTVSQAFLSSAVPCFVARLEEVMRCNHSF